MRFGKWIGGGLGWAMGGPLGGVLGFAIGSLFDNASDIEGGATQQQTRGRTYGRTRTGAGDFAFSLLVLSATVMRADGKVKRSELDYVKRYFTQNFGEAKAQEMVQALREVLKQDFSVRQVCLQIRANMTHPMRLQLLQYLFGIAEADGKVDVAERRVLQTIATYLGISPKDYGSHEAMYVKQTDSDYKILEINKSATDDEVKKAYRKMAKKYHPDKVSTLGEEFQKAAKEKFQRVQQAYDNICKSRGIR